jgi:hypothetical protein
MAISVPLPPFFPFQMRGPRLRLKIILLSALAVLQRESATSVTLLQAFENVRTRLVR